MSLFEGFDFIQAEKDATKKVEELASVVERVATIFLDGVGSLENQLKEMQGRLSKVETQIETLLRVGTGRASSATGATPSPDVPPPPLPKVSAPDVVHASPGVRPEGPPPPPSEPPQAPTSPMGGPVSIKAAMRGELESFLARRRAALEARMQEEEGG